MRKNNPRRQYQIGRLTVGAGGALAVFVIVFHFSVRILPGVSVGRVPVGNLTQREAVERVARSFARPLVTLTTGERSVTVAPEELGVSIDAHRAAATAYAFGRVVGRSPRVTPSLAIQDETFQAFLDAYESAIAVKPRDAAVQLVNGTFTVVPAEAGVILDREDLRAQLTQLAPKAVPVTIAARFVPRAAAVSEDDVRPLVDEAMALASRTLTIRAEGRNVVVGPEMLAQWLAVTTARPSNIVASTAAVAPAKTTVSLDIDASSVRSFLQQHLSELESAPIEQRVLMSRHQVEVLQEGTFGKKLIIDEAVAAIRASVLSDSNDPVDLPTIAVPPPTAYVDPPPAPVATGKVVGVDLTKQRAYLYDDGQLTNSVKISSGINDWTPTGTFHIYAKTKRQKMSGPGYYLPNVPNIMWFKGDYSLHGVYWHHDFGIRPRSHGCVGMSVEDSAWVFDWSEVGTPVVIYKG